MKKVKETVKAMAPKSLSSKAVPVTPTRPGWPPKSLKPADDPRHAQAVHNYEAGLKALQAHKFDKAKGFFEKVKEGASPELADRAAVHGRKHDVIGKAPGQREEKPGDSRVLELG